MSQTYTVAEVAQHNKEGDAWIIIEGDIYDVSKFARLHPGGKGVIERVAGQDVTELYKSLHADSVLLKYKKRLLVGKASDAKSRPPPAPKTDGIKTFGNMIPYGDPAWYQGWNSKYYNESHIQYRKVVREFVEKEITPNVTRWEENKKIPREVYTKLGAARFFGGTCGPPWPTEYIGEEGVGGLDTADYDAFHELISIEELAKAGSGGLMWGLFAGIGIGLPPVLHFGTQDPAVQEEVCKSVFLGEKIICLAITEPYGGSDVANLHTTAELTPDGKHYIVNGEKKWITNGVFADYFTTAVRTGGPGFGGISLLLIPRTEGVTTKQMKCQGVWPSGTTYITFENVKVPVENIIGEENEGFKCIMFNFNHERWGLVAMATALARVCVEESIKHAFRRKTFGKRLIEHPVIRLKIAEMARQVEATHSWLETITYQMKEMDLFEKFKLAGPIALAKVQSTKVLEYCAREAAQIFGGAAYTRTGLGEKVERIYREVRAYAIPGGSEEIMLDLGMKMSMRQAKTSRARL